MNVHLSLPSIIALSFFLTILAPSYCDEDENFKNCSRSSTCGNVTYSFPYWGGGRPKYCGLEEYELECHNNEYPVMSFQAVAGEKALEFRVLRIDSSSGTITVARSDLLADLCAPMLLDTSLNYTLFDYPSNYPSTVQNITVFYGCLSATIQERNRFSCSQDNGHVNGFVEDESPQGYQLAELRRECPKSIRIPILRNSPLLREPSDVRAALSAAINGGFEVEYNRALAASCTPCVASRGICGSNATGSFVCFCEDQTEAHTCPKRGLGAFVNNICAACEESGGICGSNATGSFVCFCKDQMETHTCTKRGDINWRRKVGIAVGASVGSVAIMCIIFWIRQRRYKKKHAPSPFVSRSMSSYPSSVTDSDVGSRYFGVPLFTYAVLERATKNFDSSNELGEGGFGTVYYGKLRDGREVAVKRLYENNCRRMEQFMNEVVILTRLRHRNLVSLYGCTSRHSRELLLVYEYIPNGTVADHIHGEKAKPGGLPWTTRMKIAVETASALAYLHASDVIHRDVKTNNILLDNHFCVKVADFGLSRLFPTDVTHISTAPQGTPGYVDPEYHQCYQLTDKSDVFSFGVVLIELISSLPAMDITRHRHEINLSNMAINKIQNNALQEFVDPSLGFESDYTIRRMITAVAELAFECLQSAQEMRPPMEEVLKRLEDIRNKDYGKDKAEEIRISADDAVLLGRDSLPLSPDSAPHWTSSSTLSISSS